MNMHDQASSVQDQMMTLVSKINGLQGKVARGDDLHLQRQLKNIAVALENLTAEFPAMCAYELTVKGVSMPEDQNVVHTVLPKIFGDLAISAKAKLAYERTVREAAAVNLLPAAVEEALEGGYGKLPRIMPRNVDIRAV